MIQSRMFPKSSRSQVRRLALAFRSKSAMPQHGGAIESHCISTSNQLSSLISSGGQPIYVAATRQHVGKTTTCLALMAGLKKRFPHTVGFMKPVGQQCVPVYSDLLGKEIRVDKDVALMKEHFAIHRCDYKHMSPVLIPKGYTKDYIDGKISHEEQLHSIKEAYHYISSSNEVVLCEGTGHSAVGSIVSASNAQVASTIGAKMILVANGGLGENLGPNSL